MDRCPNCGAPARPGAKFCTTCGFRLDASPPAVAGVPDDPTAATDDASPPPDAVPVADATETQEGIGDPVAADVPEAVDSVPASWGTGWGTPTEAADSPTATSDALGLEAWDATVEAAAPADEDAIASAFSEPASATAAEDALSTNQAQREESPAPTPAVPSRTGGHASLARANALIDELRALLPTLAPVPGATPARDLSTVIADLDAARQPPDAARAREFDALRDALERARDRPRDIDALLDLVGRVDVVLALQDEHDRYAAAIDNALAELRDGV